ncbi:MAG TPA: hypothetical protein VI279_16295 [Rhodocyclaceae bacterium]
MLSMRDCLDYCDLNEDEVKLIAHHEHLSFACAAQLACCLVQSDEGEAVVRCMLEDVINEAASSGEEDERQVAEQAFTHFNRYHPADAHSH